MIRTNTPSVLPFTLSVCILLTLAVCLPTIGFAQSSPRQRIRLDAGWRFHLAEAPALENAVAITDWRWKPDDNGANDAAQMADPALDTSGADWQSAKTGDDIFHGRLGFAWMRTTLPAMTGPGRILHFNRVDDNGTVYLNGKLLLRHEGWDDPFDVPLDSAWNATGPNVLAVLVENTDGEGGITRPATLGVRAESHLGDPSQPGFDDSLWRTVHLPHDYVVEGTFTPDADTGHGSLPVAPAWYRKTFTLPTEDKGKSVWIDFDGVYRDAKVYLNGQLLGEHPSGYTSFRYDIRDVAHYGEPNVLAVSVDPRHFEGWWYEGGGIYRHVWLNVADRVHVAPWGTLVTAALPEPGPSGQVAPATLTIKTMLTNADAAVAAVELVSKVVDDRGISVGEVSTPVTVAAGRSEETAQQIVVAHPRLWSLETPRLYRLLTTVRRGDHMVDTVETPFGIRTIRFDAAQGFFLNGKHVEIQGACNHQDFAGVGIGVPDGLEAWRVQKLKEIGCNAWRMSHNPPTPELLDACDRLGMLVMDENRHLGDTFNMKTSRGTPYSDMSELDSMVLRDRNHPSIILWSMCNEEPLQSTPEGARIFSAMRQETLRLDPSRPVSCAMNDGRPLGIALVEDIRGFNYGPGDYAGYHQQFPTMPLYGSEVGSSTETRGIYADDPAKGYVTAYDIHGANTAQDTWTPIASQPFMAGGFVWTGFDYKGEPSPYGWPCINSHFGILDMCGFPKDDGYYYQVMWGGRPRVHIFPHWNWPGKEGQPISVWAYSNADQVELFLNGKSLGRKDMPRYRHLEWSVPYTPGTLEARAYTNGRVVATDRVETTGAPAALRLKTDRTTLTADGEDVTVVEVDVVDAQGRIVPIADNRITFSVSGAGQIAGVGNGDPSDHDPDKADLRRAFNGRCAVLVGATDQAGPIHLTATSPGLASAQLDLRSHP